MALTASETVFSASMSRPLSVSSRIASFGSSSAICSISLRFFSPPEKPTLTARFSISSRMPSALVLARISLTKARASWGVSPRAVRTAFTASFRKVVLATPGISTGYWKARNSPLAARSSGSSARMSSPSKRTWPSVTS